MTEQITPSLFTPSITDPRILESILVQRNEMLNDAIERVKESANTGNKHHLLFVGPRGTGKTHLMTLLVHRLDQDIKLDKKLRIAWLNEDETSTTLLAFLKRIYIALNKRHAEEFDLQSLNGIYDLKVNEAKNYLSKLLLEKLKKHTLLVVVENLDALFEALKKSGQQELRAFIQENPVLSIVATAQKLTDDISKRKSTFFGFFQTEQLKTLSVDDAAELLEKIAQLNKQNDVVKFLRSATGRSRIRALFHLSGGNHRIYIALSKFINHDSINQLVDLFSKMIDEMTPYYQEKIRSLAPQQRQIIEYLCTCERPASVKKIARFLFVSNQSISSQLKNLREKGYVESAQRGRESLYEIAEPLMRLCVEVKENQSTEPLRMLIDFLRVWYNGEELTNRLSGCGAKGIEYTYLRYAIEKNKLNGNLRLKLIIDGFRSELNKTQDHQWNNRIDSYANSSEELAIAFGLWSKGNDTEAIKILGEISNNNISFDDTYVSTIMLMGEIYFERKEWLQSVKCLNSIIKLSNIGVDKELFALLNRGHAFGKLDEIEKSIEDYSTIIERKSSKAEIIGLALLSRGDMHERVNDKKNGIIDYSKLISLQNMPSDLVAKGLLNRAALYGDIGDKEKEMSDLSTCINIKGAHLDEVSKALFLRGVTYGDLGDTRAEIQDYSSIIKMEGIYVKLLVQALFNRAVTYEEIGDVEKGIRDYSRIVNLKNASIDEVLLALFRRASAYSQIKEHEKELFDYQIIINLEDSPPEKVTEALLLSGMTHALFSDKKKAISDLTSCINNNKALVAQVAEALLFRGGIYKEKNNLDMAGKDFQAILQIGDISDSLRVFAQFELSGVYIAIGRWDEAMTILNNGLSEGASLEDTGLYSFVEFINYFYTSTLASHVREDRVITLIGIYKNNNAIASLGDALIGHLGLLSDYNKNMRAIDDLESWASAWENALKDINEFRLPQRIFRTGIDFLKAKGEDLGILLDLNQEERQILEQALGLDEEI